MFDALAAGDSAAALAVLERLFDQGEEPMRLLAILSTTLRRLAQAGRLAMQGMPLQIALEQAGVHKFGLRSAEQQIRHLGRKRVAQLYDWLLEVDQGIKGGSALPPQTLLERLMIRLGRKDQAAAPSR